jgi:NHLM bacteriocin system ABC transporter ATP-binding protein
MEEWFKVFEAEGTPREVAGNSPLPLDEPDGVWLVRSGPVDVFAQPVIQDGAAGPRVHLFRAETGQVLFGVRVTGPEPGIRLVAVGGPGSQVLRLPRRRYEELAVRPDLRGPAAALLDGWVRGLTAGAAGHWGARRVAVLEPGREVALAAGGIVSPARGTLWVRHLQGSSLPLGKDVPALEAGDGLFPLADTGWLAAREADTRLAGMTTEAALGEENVWPALDCFHRVLLTCVAINLAEAEAAERGRLRRRARAERRVVRATLERLADAAQGGGEEDASAPAPEEPLLAACRLVGSRLGIDIQAPPGGTRRGRRDPVGAIARASRLRVRRVVLSGDWWRRDNGPLLAFLAPDERPVALLPVSPSRYELADPAAGKRSRLTGAAARAVLPFAYTLYRPFPARPLTVCDVFRFGFPGSGGDWARVALLGLAGGLLGLLTPVATGWIFDRIIPGAERNQLLVVVLALAAAALAGALFQLARGAAVLRAEARMEGAVQAGVWDRLLNLPAPFFRRYAAGDLASRALGIADIRQVLTDVALSSVLSFVFSLVYFALLFYYDVRLALLACGLFGALLLVTALVVRVQLRYQRRIYEARGKIAGLVLQLVTGIARLRVAGAEDRALAVWGRQFGAQRELSFRARSVANGLAAFNAAVPVVNLMALFAVVALLPSAGLSLGAFLAFSVAFAQVLSAALFLGSNITYAIQVVPLYERARPILEAVPEVDAARADPGDLGGDVEVSHVTFRYRPDGPPVLEDLSLHVRPGEIVAFVGPSGAGKSTLMRLLLGFEAPAAGSIYYDRADLAGLDLHAVRRQIGVVLQDGKVTAGDIFSNIVGASVLTLDDAWEAARLSGLDDDIARMPMGMHTVVPDGGGTLSGGQRQRLLIARAVVARPRILLFDEATSALDNETQARVARSLEGLKATRIVIAHRLTTVRNADRIYVLDRGRVVQQGCYGELLDQPGLFADLARRQLA